jgi:hypothetical protein
MWCTNMWCKMPTLLLHLANFAKHKAHPDMRIACVGNKRGMEYFFKNWIRAQRSGHPMPTCMPWLYLTKIWYPANTGIDHLFNRLITYFLTYLYVRLISYKMDYQGETKY